MSTFQSPLRGLAAAAALGVAVVAPAAAQTGAPSEGFIFCARPARPGCLRAPDAYATAQAAAECRQAINRYIDQTFVYRACLEREITRAVREANDSLALDKCRAARRRNCL